MSNAKMYTQAQIQIVVNSLEREGLFTNSELAQVKFLRGDLMNVGEKNKAVETVKTQMLRKIQLRKEIIDEYISVIQSFLEQNSKNN